MVQVRLGCAVHGLPVERRGGAGRKKRLLLDLGELVVTVVGTEVRLAGGRHTAGLGSGRQFLHMRQHHGRALEERVVDMDDDRRVHRLAGLRAERRLALSYVVHAH